MRPALFLATMACLTLPFTAPAAPRAEAALERTITGSFADQPLGKILASASRQSGVTMRVSQSYEDRAVTLRARGLTAAELRAGLAALYGDLWSRTESDGKAVFVLESSLARRKKQRQLFQLQEQAVRQGFLDSCREMAEGPPEWVRTRYSSPRLQKEFKGRGAVLLALPPDLLSRLLSGGTARFSLPSAPGELGEQLRSFAGEFHRGDLERLWAHFSSRSFVSGGVPGVAVDFVLGGEGSGRARFSLSSRPEAVSRRLGEVGEVVATGEQDPSSAPWAETRLPAVEPFGAGERRRSDLLLSLAEQLDVNLFADSHTKAPRMMPALSGKTAREALNLIAGTFGLRWRAAPSLLVRSACWCKDDADEPPATLVARWEDLLEKNGALTLDETLPIALLTPEQHARLSVRIPTAENAGAKWLRFYAALTPPQRREARAPEGLRMGSVPEPQRRVLLEGDAMSAFFGRPDYKATLMHPDTVLLVEEVVREEVGVTMRDVSFRILPARPGRGGFVTAVRLP
jgi:hypothetical protein